MKRVTVTFLTDGVNMDDDILGTVKEMLGERLTTEQVGTIQVSVEEAD
jgi:hypothetical protein